MRTIFAVPIALALLTSVAWGATSLTVGTTAVHQLCGANSLKCSGVTCGKTTCDASCSAGSTPASGCTLVILQSHPGIQAAAVWPVSTVDSTRTRGAARSDSGGPFNLKADVAAAN